MKAISIFITACCLTMSALAQKDQVSDFASWPAPLKDKIIRLDPANAFSVSISKIEETALTELLKNSSLSGTLNAEKVTEQLNATKYQDTAIIAYDKQKKELIIKVSRMLNKITEKDSLILKLKSTASDKGITYTILKAKATAPANTTSSTSPPKMSVQATDLLNDEQLNDYFKSNYLDNDYKLTDVGYKKKDEIYTIHIFFDQLGNPLFSSVPTGIQRKYHYKIHILYPKYLFESGRFLFKQTAGTLTDEDLYYNSAVTAGKAADGKSQSENQGQTQKDMTIIDHSITMLPTSDELAFNILYFKGGNPAEPVQLNSTKIKKTAFYKGSFDVGILYTWLNNPTFTSVNSPADASKQTLKVTNDKPAIIGSFMYTLYVSPVNLIFPEGRDGRRFNAWGRSYLDDEGSFIRKIYPCLGVGLSGELLTNWFFGLNIQPMQGFGIFAGKNVRKVNTFDMPGLIPGETLISTEQFNYYQNTKTKSNWTIGIVLDTNIFNKIIGSVSTP
ncbi:hypothetical protein IM793_23030 [Pedobacter sp. MR2016-19]|uniref:hypothetical protein n=1 Tax=Pedobacter sp. MR2016-19 TaxID=2780089 RepID=UPI0018751678|nr:hypothetical protein [Pedobacter sp. MR2016-19]MBE5322048.1 hypothetical protein [Pedobacter sp. MR2016-19]